MAEQNGAATIRWGSDVYARNAGLEQDLIHLRECGYDAAEFSMDALQCIVGGRVLPQMVERAAAVCERFADQFVYSVHSPAVLDLRDRHYPELHREILLSSVRVSAAIKARVLVVHYESESGDAAIEAQFRRAIEEAAELAGRHQLILGVENIEVERAERVLAFLEALNHPWVRLTYDFGHDYLAGDLFGYDHRASARAAAPYVAHLHITDNCGHFNQARLGDFNLWRAIPHSNLVITGLGDLHLPIGYGTLPMQKVFDAVTSQGFSGAVVSEHDRHGYGDADREVLGRMRALAEH